MGKKMAIEFGGRDDKDRRQQQQGGSVDLTDRYQAIGIPAVTAATICKPKVEKPTGQQQASVFDRDDS